MEPGSAQWSTEVEKAVASVCWSRFVHQMNDTGDKSELEGCAKEEKRSNAQ